MLSLAYSLSKIITTNPYVSQKSKLTFREVKDLAQEYRERKWQSDV